MALNKGIGDDFQPILAIRNSKGYYESMNIKINTTQNSLAGIDSGAMVITPNPVNSQSCALSSVNFSYFYFICRGSHT